MILVTGGTGLVGSHLLYLLTSQGHRVKALFRTSKGIEQVKKLFAYYTASPEEWMERIEWIEGDLLEIPDLDQVLEGVDQVYHCAAMVSFHRKEKSAMLKNNIEGTARIVNACLERTGIQLCFVSSIAALGSSSEGEMVTEEHIWKPSGKHSAYSKSKFLSEMEVWRGISEGLSAVIVNPAVILGPGNWEKSSASFFREVYRGMPFYTNGVTGYVDVRDVVNGMVKLMDQKIFGERFILVSENKSYREVFSQMAAALGKKAPSVMATPWMTKVAATGSGLYALLTGKAPVVTRDTARSAHSITSYSNDKIRKALNVSFISVEESIRDTALVFLKDQQTELAGKS